MEVAGRESTPYRIASPGKLLDRLRIVGIDSPRRSHQSRQYAKSWRAGKIKRWPINSGPLWGLIAKSASGRIAVRIHSGCASPLRLVPEPADRLRRRHRDPRRGASCRHCLWRHLRVYLVGDSEGDAAIPRSADAPFVGSPDAPFVGSPDRGDADHRDGREHGCEALRQPEGSNDGGHTSRLHTA